MELDELAFLAALAAQVPKGGRIIEVGPLYGRSTNAMAMANPGAKVTSIDTFQPAAWTEKYSNQFRDIPTFGVAAFEAYTKHLPNVEKIVGASPRVVHNWATPIDLYFEDAIHGNPQLAENLDFWMARLRPGGIACGHDYCKRFPDVKREVDARAKTWGCPVELVGTMWALRKPKAYMTRADACSIDIVDGPKLSLTTMNKNKGLSQGKAGYWCGAHMSPDRLTHLQIETAIDLEYRVGHPEFGASEWTQPGRPARLVSGGQNRPFTRFAIRSSGQKMQPFYRVSSRQVGNNGYQLSGVSNWGSGGDWASLRKEGPGLCAITACMLETAPPDAQSAFKKRALTQVKYWARHTHNAILSQRV
ncbi:MAG: class I SAM-dependent methyltransferase [Paracoccaceae bacterium]